MGEGLHPTPSARALSASVGDRVFFEALGEQQNV